MVRSRWHEPDGAPGSPRGLRLAAARAQRGSPARANRRRRVPLREKLPSLAEVVSGARAAVRRGASGLVMLGLVGALAAAAWGVHAFITTSSRFAIADVEIHGAVRMDHDQILAQLATRLGDNIFAPDLQREERALVAHPWIASASVRRRLPNHLAIDLVEEVPAALVAADGLYLADAHGRLFKRADLARGDGDGLPVITGIPTPLFASAPAMVAEQITTALAAAARWSSAGRPALGEINVDLRRGLTLHTRDRAIAVRLGDGTTDLTERLAYFDTTWRALSEDQRARVRAVHLGNRSRPDHVTVALSP